MADIKLLESVDQYINKYYVPAVSDIRADEKAESIIDVIKKSYKKRAREEMGTARDRLSMKQLEICDDDSDFDVDSMQKSKLIQPMAATIATNRKISDLMNQLEETFSQRLLRMIDERGMTDSEAYTKAYIDRRHFSKIRKDINYTPNKKTVLAFAIALELSLDETMDLLRCAGYALSRSSKMDVIVAYFLQNHIYDMFEINDVLYTYEQPLFE